MIRLTDLAGKGSFTMGGKKFEYGKVYSNPYVNAFKPVNEAEESEDHEVSMAQNQLDSIIKHATELKQKMGEEEKQIPAWIQDHITNSENYISQAASNYHEYGDSNERVNEAGPCWKGYKQVGMKSKGGKQVPNCVPEGVVTEAAGVPKMYVKYLAVQKKVRELEDKQRAMGAKYYAEKDPKKKEAMMPALKKGTAQLAGYRRNLADIEEKYIDNMYDDTDMKAARAANRDMKGYGGIYNSDFD
jgi:vacuolar-type H+-ATPase subunit H